MNFDARAPSLPLLNFPFNNGGTDEWKLYRNKVQQAIDNAKTHFYRDRVMQLKQDDPSSWYRHIKLMSSSSQTSKIINVPGASQAQPATVANVINGHFSSVSANMSRLDPQGLPAYLPARQPPKLQPWEVFKELSKVRPGKSAGPDGIPAKLVHLFAAELSTLLCDVLNTSFAEGTPPCQWKQAIVVPVPKEQPPRLERLRPIALTDHFAKVAEQFMSKWLLADLIPVNSEVELVYLMFITWLTWWTICVKMLKKEETHQLL